jgi:hypothetical protein
MITLGIVIITGLLKDRAFVEDGIFVTGLFEDDIFIAGLLEDDIFLIWPVFFIIDGPGLLLVFFWDSVSGNIFRAGGLGGILVVE